MSKAAGGEQPEITISDEEFLSAFIKKTIELFQEDVEKAGWCFKVVTRREDPHPSLNELKAICREKNWSFTGYYERINKNVSHIYLKDLMLSQEVLWGMGKRNTFKIIVCEELERLEIIGIPTICKEKVKEFIDTIGVVEYWSSERTTNVLFSKIYNKNYFKLDKIEIPFGTVRYWNLKFNWYKINKIVTTKLTKIKPTTNDKTKEEEFQLVYTKKRNNKRQNKSKKGHNKAPKSKDEMVNKPKKFTIDQPQFGDNIKTTMYNAKNDYLASINSTPMQSSCLGKTPRKRFGNTPPSAEAKKRKGEEVNDSEMMDLNEENNIESTNTIEEKQEEEELNPPGDSTQNI